MCSTCLYTIACAFASIGNSQSCNLKNECLDLIPCFLDSTFCKLKEFSIREESDILDGKQE